ncbi:helix-turn-helix transcriptional regulator [Fibrella aestuarina]|uniref:Helix-turn-helix transcriptional regulator n=2 Tax=Fibrivirga algicola TaxID=2950420 RepID=A0ABX0QM50_9BACT|nr:helix-turn-helix transcriptional regulator [Fibrivirga algicola]
MSNDRIVPGMEQLEKENDAYAALVARRMAKVREFLKMSQQELADEFGTTQNLIYRLENGLKVSREMFTLIALYYVKRHKVSYEWLFNPEQEEEPNVPMFTNEVIKRQRINDQREAQRLALLHQFMEEISKVEQKPD